MNAFSDRQQKIVSWLRRGAIPLTTVESGHGFADLRPMKTVFGSARIVALGEATHGTREFFQLKHRLVEFLVMEMGFTTFAIEANWPESLVINDYILHGQGDPAKALAGLHFWTWNTQEVLDLIHWMRHYNVNTTQKTKVTFAGFDAQFTALAAATIKRYLDRVDPAFAAETTPRIVLFEKEYRDYSTLPEADIDSLQSTVRDLEERLGAEEPTYVARSTLQEWRLARQYVRILRQVHEQRRADDDKTRYMIRDRAMAENAAWILENEGPRNKMVIWAHNGHVTRDSRGIFDGAVTSMGMHLARKFDPELVVVGFAFGQGAFQAVVKEEEMRRPIREVTIGPPPQESLDAVLARTGIPVFVLDLRRVDDSVATWLQEPQVTREIGAFFESPENMCETIFPMARYDVVAFVAETTCARPNPMDRSRTEV
jgi:erythromycin esterase